MGDPALGRRPVRAVAVWALALAAVTVTAAIWLDASGGDYREVSPEVVVIAYAPGYLALLVAAVTSGGGLAALLRQFARWRVGIGWYAAVLIGPVALMLAASAAVVLGGAPSPAAWMVLPGAASLPALVGPLIAGSLGEEPGWRGFAQRRLQQGGGLLLAAITVGALWSCWHLWPLLTSAGRASLTAADVGETFVRLISTSVIYAWLYHRTNGSLPIVMLAHAGHNIAIDMMAPAVADVPATGAVIAGLYLAVALGVVIVDRQAGWRRPDIRSSVPRASRSHRSRQDPVPQ